MAENSIIENLRADYSHNLEQYLSSLKRIADYQEDHDPFKIYQLFRAAIFDLSKQRKITVNNARLLSYLESLSSVGFLDIKYAKNFYLSISLNTDNKDQGDFERQLAVLDSCVYPDPRNDGWGHYDRYLSAYIVKQLMEKFGESKRQCQHFTAQTLGINSATTDKYMEQISKFEFCEDNSDHSLLELIILAIFFFRLFQRDTNIKTLKPIIISNDRSKNAFSKCIRSYERYKTQLFYESQETAEPLLVNPTDLMKHIFEAEFMRETLELYQTENASVTEEQLAAVLILRVIDNIIPNFFEGPLESFISEPTITVLSG